MFMILTIMMFTNMLLLVLHFTDSVTVAQTIYQIIMLTRLCYLNHLESLFNVAKLGVQGVNIILFLFFLKTDYQPGAIARSVAMSLWIQKAL